MKRGSTFKIYCRCIIVVSGYRFHFFPKTSWAYFESQYVKSKDIDMAMAAARKTWLGDFTKPEKDAYHEMVFGQEDPLDDGFTLEGVDATIQPSPQWPKPFGCRT